MALALRCAARAFSVAASTSATAATDLVTLTEAAAGVLEVRLNRPDKANALCRRSWAALRAAFEAAAATSTCRAIILSGAGRHFTAGLDLTDHAELVAGSGGGGGGAAAPDPARRAFALHGLIRSYQVAVSALERVPQPVIACVHGHCVGAGVDIIAAADVRLASADATFCVREVALGLAADVGTLQRLPRIVGSASWVAEVALTARRFSAEEAAARGLLSDVLVDADALRARALALARAMAAHSPVAVQGTKANLVFSRDRPVADGLAYAAAWNAAMLQTGDIAIAAMAAMGGRGAAPPTFADVAMPPAAAQ